MNEGENRARPGHVRPRCMLLAGTRRRDRPTDHCRCRRVRQRVIVSRSLRLEFSLVKGQVVWDLRPAPRHFPSQSDTAGSHNIWTALSTSLEPVGATMPPRAAQSLLLLWRDAATPQVLHPPCPRPARTARASASVHRRPVSALGRKCLRAASGLLPARTAAYSRLRAASSA